MEFYQGEFMEEDRYEDWPTSTREHLREDYLDNGQQLRYTNSLPHPGLRAAQVSGLMINSQEKLRNQPRFEALG